jgi:hypothetical protein
MGKASSAKKVARAERAGGSARAGSGRRFGFPMAIAAIVIVGVLLVVFARTQRSSSAVAPELGVDHWHSAYGVWACDQFLPPFTDTQGDALGIHTHEDGLIHIHPSSSLAAGENATLGVFADEIGLELGDGEFTTATGETFKTGDDCQGEPGVVQVLKWTPDNYEGEPEVFTENFEDIRFDQNGNAYVIAFMRPDEDVPLPPSLGSINNPGDLAPGETAPEPVEVPENLGSVPTPTTVVTNEGTAQVEPPTTAPPTTAAP